MTLHTETPIEFSHHGFGFSDTKGRAVGVKIGRWTEEYSEAEPLTRYIDRATVSFGAGTFFFANVSPTRNEQKFGAAQSSEFFGTEAEREAYIAKRIEGTRKRYVKLLGAASPVSSEGGR